MRCPQNICVLWINIVFVRALSFFCAECSFGYVGGIYYFYFHIVTCYFLLLVFFVLGGYVRVNGFII